MIKEKYYNLFSRVIFLMTQNNRYDYGMSLLLFSYLISLYTLPFIFLVLAFTNLSAKIASVTLMAIFAIIVWYNYYKTKSIHKEVYLANRNRKGSRFAVLKYFVLGFILFMFSFILIGRVFFT